MRWASLISIVFVTALSAQEGGTCFVAVEGDSTVLERPEWRWELKDNVPDGVWTIFSLSGTKIFQGTIKHGRREGEFLYYGYEGELQEIKTYHKGKLDGPHMIFLKDGKVQSVGRWEKGKRAGCWYWWQEEWKYDENGKPLSVTWVLGGNNCYD